MFKYSPKPKFWGYKVYSTKQKIGNKTKQRKQQNRKPCALIILSVKVSPPFDFNAKGLFLMERIVNNSGSCYLFQGTILTIMIKPSEVHNTLFTLRKALTFPKIRTLWPVPPRGTSEKGPLLEGQGEKNLLTRSLDKLKVGKRSPYTKQCSALQHGVHRKSQKHQTVSLFLPLLTCRKRIRLHIGSENATHLY